MKFFNLHTHISSNDENILDLINQYPWQFDEEIKNYSVGIHPWYIDINRLESDLEIIKQKLSIHACFALGECGLDKRIEIDFKTQRAVFEQQIILAEAFQKPIIVHCVGAFQEVIEIKKRLKISVPMIIHGFSKNEIIAKELLKHGFYLSFGKYLLQNPDLKSVFEGVPNNRFFLETDTLSDSIKLVYEKAALYKNCSVNEIQTIIKSNFENVFRNHKL